MSDELPEITSKVYPVEDARAIFKRAVPEWDEFVPPVEPTQRAKDFIAIQSLKRAIPAKINGQMDGAVQVRHVADAIHAAQRRGLVKSFNATFSWMIRGMRESRIGRKD